jgi:hypothetical protein
MQKLAENLFELYALERHFFEINIRAKRAADDEICNALTLSFLVKD